MKKSVVLLLLCGIAICLTILTYFQMNNKNKLQENNIINKNKFISIMIKDDGEEEYKQPFYNTIPKGYYVLNEEKTYCKNNSKVGNYDNTTGTVSFSFIGTDECHLYFDVVLPGYLKVLKANGGVDAIVAKGKPDFSVSATTDEGMFAAEDDNGTSYYFRGAVSNNWVKVGKYNSDVTYYRGYYSETDSRFYDWPSLSDCTNSSAYNYKCTEIPYAKAGDDMYWRIVRINGDNSIRLIYSGAVAPRSEKEAVMKKNDSVYVGTSVFNANHTSPYYVGFKYDISYQHGYGTSSTILKSLYDWYGYTSFNTTDSSLLANQIICNDRTMSQNESGPFGDASLSTSITWYYGFYGRYLSGTPSLVCPTETDKFYVKGDSYYILSHPVGLLTADEAVVAGLSYNNKNSESYLVPALTDTNAVSYWLVTPYYSAARSNNVPATSYGTGISWDSTINEKGIIATLGVRPVISLSDDVYFDGSGTWNDPYVVSE